MKVVVTGGTGFLGRHIVWRLAASGHDVVFTGRRLEQATLVSATAARAVRFVRLDHGSPGAADALKIVAHKADAMIHCAALAAPWGRCADFERANVTSTHEALAACQETGTTRLVHISSPSIYFDYKDRLAIREDSVLPRGVNLYARSKRAAEEAVATASIAHRVILRPRAIFGPWDNALMPRLLRLLRYGQVPLLRGGRAWLDMTYVGNAVDAVVLSLCLPEANAPYVFNISNGEPVTVADLFSRIGDRFGLPLRAVHRPYAIAHMVAATLELAARAAPGWEPPFTRYSLGTLAFSQTLDLRRAREVLGYQPLIRMDDAIDRTARWQRERGLGHEYFAWGCEAGLPAVARRTLHAS